MNYIKQTSNGVDKKQIPVVILCGGKGTRLKEETQAIPKPLVKIGDRPILWHIIKIYRAHGFSKFILPIGYKGEKIKEYFHEKTVLHSLDLDEGQIEIVDTGLDTMTGARLKKVEKFITSPTFILTYGDGVANVDLNELLSFHLERGGMVTLTGVRQPARFGELEIEGVKVVGFQEKPQKTGYINGGFFVMKKDVLKLFPDSDTTSLESDVLPKVAKLGELAVFCHDGYWQCMDTLHDVEFLNEEWQTGRARWKVW